MKLFDKFIDLFRVDEDNDEMTRKNEQETSSFSSFVVLLLRSTSKSEVATHSWQQHDSSTECRDQPLGLG